MLTNAAIDGRTRRERRRQEVPLSDVDGREPPDAAADRALRSVDDKEKLRRALSRLTTRQRAVLVLVLVLRYWDDLPEQEVAEMLGCSVGTVKSTASRALAQLRSNLTTTPLRKPATDKEYPCRTSR